MKALLLLFFIISSYVAQSQSFMMYMNIRETVAPTTIVSYKTKVIWGIKQDTFAILWNDRYLYLSRKSKYGKNTARIRKKIEEVLNHKDTRKEERAKHIVFRELFYNQWGELYLVTVYMNKGCVILINRLDAKYPHYRFQMSPESLMENMIWRYLTLTQKP